MSNPTHDQNCACDDCWPRSEHLPAPAADAGEIDRLQTTLAQQTARLRLRSALAAERAMRGCIEDSLAVAESKLAAERAAGAAMRKALRDIAESQPAALAGVRVTQLEMSRNLSNFLGELQTRAARALVADRETEEESAPITEGAKR